MIGYPMGHLIGYPTRDPKGYPNRPRIARIGPARIGPARPLLTTSVALHHIVAYVTRATATKWWALRAGSRSS